MKIWQGLNIISPECSAKTWTSPVYGCFDANPTIKIVNGCWSHEFQCSAKHCKGKSPKPCIVCCFLDMADKGSTSNMHKHAKICWCNSIIKELNEKKDRLTLDNIWRGLAATKMVNGKGKVKLMNRQHTYKEAWWVNLYGFGYASHYSSGIISVLNTYYGAQRICIASALSMIQVSTGWWKQVDQLCVFPPPKLLHVILKLFLSK